MPRHRDSAYRRARPHLLDLIFTNHQLLLSNNIKTTSIPQEIKSCPQNSTWEEVIGLQNLVAGVMETDPTVRQRLADLESRFVVEKRDDLRDEEKIEGLRRWLIWLLDQEEEEPEDGGGVALTRGGADGEKEEEKDGAQANVAASVEGVAAATVAFPCSRGKVTMRQAAPAASASRGLDLIQIREQMKRGIVNVTALQEALDLLVDEYEMRYL